MAAPRKKPAETPAPDLSELAALSEEEITATTAPPSEDDALSAAPSAKTKPDVDDRDALIAQLQAQLAELKGDAELKREDPIPAKEEDDSVILLHFLEDGFNALGNVWYRGQELRIVKDGPEYNSTIDRNGNTWLDMLDDDQTQYRRFGKKMFARGPWPGKRWDEVSVSDFKLQQEGDREYYEAAVRRAQALEAKRAGSVPKTQ